MSGLKLNHEPKYEGARDENKQARIKADLKRDWDRHPELKARYGTYTQYMIAMKHEYTF